MGNTSSSPPRVSAETQALNRRLYRSSNGASTPSLSLHEAPPPYSPVAAPLQVPPPVPPRDVRRATSVSTAHSQVETLFAPSHRRAVSAASATSRRTTGSTPTNRQAPAGDVSRLLSPDSIPESPRNRTLAASRSMGTLRSNATGRSSGSSRQPSNAQNHQPAQSSPVRIPIRRNSREDPLEYLRRFDTVIIVDDSSSMEGPLWIEAREALAGIAETAARYDGNGIDLHFLNNPTVGTNLKRARDVKRIFDRVTPMGITPTGEKLEELLLDYLLKLESREKPKPVNFVVLTDGAPTDDPESVIVTAAKRLDAQHAPIAQVGIQFVQLGSDPEATQALQELDDELAKKYDIRDMVDTTLYSGQSLTAELLGKILLGAVNRKVDKQGFQSLM